MRFDAESIGIVGIGVAAIALFGCGSKEPSGTPSLDPELKFGALTMAQGQAYCERTRTAAKHNTKISTVARYKCAYQVLGSLDESSDRAACTAAFEKCLREPLEPEKEVDCGDTAAMQTAYMHCPELTIKDLDACVTEAARATEAAAAADPCAGDDSARLGWRLSNLERLLSVRQGPKCQAMEAACDRPAGSGGGSGSGPAGATRLAADPTLASLSAPEQATLCQELLAFAPDAATHTRIGCQMSAATRSGAAMTPAECRAELTACAARPSAWAPACSAANAIVPLTPECGVHTVGTLRVCAAEIAAIAPSTADLDACALPQQFMKAVTLSPTCAPLMPCLTALFSSGSSTK